MISTRTQFDNLNLNYEFAPMMNLHFSLSGTGITTIIILLKEDVPILTSAFFHSQLIDLYL